MTEHEKMKHFYLSNKDFKTFCDKDMQMYKRNLDDTIDMATTKEYYKSLQRGGCNFKEKQ